MKGETRFLTTEDGEFGLRVAADGGYEEVALSELKMSDFIDSSRAAVSRIAEMAKSLSPDELSVKLRLSAELRNGRLLAVIVDGTAEGSVELTLTWKCE